MVGQKAPAFSGVLTDGKPTSLKGLLAKGAVYLYFIKKDCPVNGHAEKYFNRVFEASGGHANLVGVINANDEQFQRWQNRFQAPFPVILDQEMKIIGAYRAQRSPWVIEVGKDGKVSRVWDGYSATSLAELQTAVGAKGANLEGAPADLEGG